MTEQSKNPLLDALRVPGETFRLPSGGIFYKNGELAEGVKDGEVHVHPMTAFHELTMKSPDKLFSGKAVHDIFADCIPDVIKPGELLSKDVDYLMMCLRAVSYGDMLEMPVTHTCENAKEHTYMLNTRNIIKDARAVDPTTLEKKFTLTLENGQVLKLRPPTFDRVIALYQALEKSQSDEVDSDQEFGKTMIGNLQDMIEDVNGVSNPEHILEWLNELKAGWVNMISDHIRDISDWGIESITSVKCKDCDDEVIVDVPTNPITFFT